MAGLLTHSPADVIRALLVELGLGTDPEPVPNALWPVYIGNEPASPDNVLTVYDTLGRDDGRVMIGPRGERQEHHGFQVRIRSSDHRTGYVKARSIAVSLDEDVYDERVEIEGITYYIQSVSRTSDVLALGKETPTSKRSLFTVNGVACIRQVNQGL